MYADPSEHFVITSVLIAGLLAVGNMFLPTITTSASRAGMKFFGNKIGDLF